MKKAKKKTTKKKTTKKLDLKKVSKPVKVTFSHKRNPEFEQVLTAEAQAAEVQKQKELDDYVDPNKSRGATEQQPESTMPFNAVRAVAPVLKIPFAIWSNVEEIPEMKLSTEEAEEWADPVCKMLEYYFPGKIPEIAWLWLCFLTATGKVIDSRMEIRHQHKKKISAAPQAATMEPAQAPAPLHKHNGAEPATGFPRMAE